MNTNSVTKNEIATLEIASHLRSVQAPPPEEPPTRSWWRLLVQVFEPVEFVRNVAPGQRPLRRHEWEDGTSKLGPRPPFGPLGM